MKKIISLINILLTCICTIADAQVNITDIRLSNKYTKIEIDEIKQKAPEKYAVLDYYYSKSYIIKDTNADPELIKQFNVENLEKLRKDNERNEVVDPKTGITVILFSKKETQKVYDQYSIGNNRNNSSYRMQTGNTD